MLSEVRSLHQSYLLKLIEYFLQVPQGALPYRQVRSGMFIAQFESGALTRHPKTRIVRILQALI